MPTLVATGTNGFIGTNVLEALLWSPHLDVLSTTENTSQMISAVGADLPESTARSLHNRFQQSGRMTFVEHTALEKYVRTLPERPLAIVHNGACSSTEETNPEVFDTLNLGYSKALWNLCCELEIPFIYASSAGVYGDGSQGFSDKKEHCARYTALSLYAKSKLDFDLWVLEQKRTPPSWFGLRYFNVYGPNEDHKNRQASMVFHLFHQIQREKKVKLYKSTSPDYTDGGQMRDFVYVKDIAKLTTKLIALAAQRKANPHCCAIPGNGLFLNIGAGVPQTWNTLVQEVFEALKLPSHIEYINMPEKLAKQYQNYTCADLSSWKTLGIDPAPTSLHNGVLEYVQSYLAPKFG
jgi:ADP-L-glycero-D-manno-heptose 6-epimerase